MYFIADRGMSYNFLKIKRAFIEESDNMLTQKYYFC